MEPVAWFAGKPGPGGAPTGLLASGLAEVSDDVTALDRGGWWAVVMTFEGQARLLRCNQVRPSAAPPSRGRWRGPAQEAWTSSTSRAAYVTAVSGLRQRIREGEVYQANLCRVLSAAPPDERAADPWALAARLAARHPAPHAGIVDGPAGWVVCASPELFLERRGSRVASGPIKGTATSEDAMLAKDHAENVMIVDLVRNDLSRVAVPGSVEVTRLVEPEHHPGLVHLASRVEAQLARGAGWADLLHATFPPGSVTGAPRSTATRAIADLEPVARGPYCGAVGWVDSDTGHGHLAVGIRTFWRDGHDAVRFGTGAGITWGSDPTAEWVETELKASRLVGLASDVQDPIAPDGPRTPMRPATR